MKRAKKKSSKRRGLKDIEVTVTVDGETLTVEPLTARIKKSGEQVKWICVGGRMDVSFDKDMSPFFDPGFSAPASKARKRKSVSGEPTVMLAAGQTRTFSYTMTVNPTGGRPRITIDPQVEVNDPGFPGRGGGHGASGPSTSSSGSGSRKKAARKKK